MKKVQFSVLLACILMGSPLWSQVSPEIQADGRVTFRIQAPGADSVSVNGQWSGEPLMLEKVKEDLWEGTTGEAVVPGVHEYSFTVDGLRTIDSRNSVIKPQRWPKTSVLHISADPPAHWDLQDIPHGTVHLHDYYSNTTKSWRKLVVYTPPNAGKRLPVLYLSHGFSDNEQSWIVTGKANTILDSLIHHELAKPMIIVMPDAHPINPEGRNDSYKTQNTQAFAKDLVEDVIPFIEAHYKVSHKASGRAFAGLSMGGGHAFTLAFQKHALFSHIGAFSASTPEVQYIRDKAEVKAINADLDLFWIACGDKDFLYEKNEVTHALLYELGIEHEYHVTENDSHSWPVWRRYLVDFLPRLFR